MKKKICEGEACATVNLFKIVINLPNYANNVSMKFTFIYDVTHASLMTQWI